MKLLDLMVRISLPRVRYPHAVVYSNRPGFHDVCFELVLMASQDLLVNESVREAILQFTSDVCYVEAFTADYIHQLQECVDSQGGLRQVPRESCGTGASDSSFSSIGSSVDPAAGEFCISQILYFMFHMRYRCGYRRTIS